MYILGEVIATVRRIEERARRSEEALQKLQAEASHAAQQQQERNHYDDDEEEDEYVNILADSEVTRFSPEPYDYRSPSFVLPFEVTPLQFSDIALEYWGKHYPRRAEDPMAAIQNVCALYLPYYSYAVEVEVKTTSLSSKSAAHSTSQSTKPTNHTERTVVDPMRYAVHGDASDWDAAFAGKTAITLFTSNEADMAPPDDDDAVASNVQFVSRETIVRPACHLADGKMYQPFQVQHSIPHVVPLTPGIDPFSLESVTPMYDADNDAVLVSEETQDVVVSDAKSAAMSQGIEERTAEMPTRCCRETWCKSVWPEFLHTIVHQQYESTCSGAKCARLGVLQVVVKVTVRNVCARTVWMPFLTGQIIRGQDGGAIAGQVVCNGGSGAFKIF
jgi:hypothetical protein